MMKSRELSTRPANRFFLGEQKEAYASVTSLEEDEKHDSESTKVKKKRYVEREQSNFRRVCNNIIPFFGWILRRRGPERECITIHCLEDDLLTRIYQYLPVIDQVCLSLSCKRFLSRYKILLARDNSKLPSQLTDRHLPLSYVHSEDKLRVHLLVRLENLRWAYCAECLSLKPRRLFTRGALRAPALKRRCAHYDGVIELCPCLHLTLRDRNHVRLLILRSPVTSRGVQYGDFTFELDKKRFNGHFCPTYSNDNRTVRVYTKVFIYDRIRLRMEVDYKLRVSSGDSFGKGGPVFACPHLDLIPLIHTAGDFTLCYKCDVSVLRKSERREEPGLVTFSVNWRLGWSERSAYSLWHSCCYDPKDKQGNSKQKRSPPQDSTNGSVIWHGRHENCPLKVIYRDGPAIPSVYLCNL